MMFSTDDDFLDRATRYLKKTPQSLEDKGDLIFNPDVRYAYESFREAAVLFSIIKRPQGLTTLLTMRPQHLKTHGGQIGFPGGKVEKEDDGPIATAAREAEEEVGLPRDNVAPLGFLDAYITGTGFRIVPVVATITPPDTFVLDENEVEAAFEVPFSFLMNPNKHDHGFLTFKGKDRFYYEMPYQDAEKRWRIWGVTAGMIRLLYETLYPEVPLTHPYKTTHNTRSSSNVR